MFRTTNFLTLLCIFSLNAAPKTNPKRISTFTNAYDCLKRLYGHDSTLFLALAEHIKNNAPLSRQQVDALEPYDLASHGKVTDPTLKVGALTIAFDPASSRTIKYMLKPCPVVPSEK